MSKSYRKDLTGKRFGRLTVIEFVPNDNLHSCWDCQCDCGNRKVISSNALKLGTTTSCGCKRIEASKESINNNRQTPKHNLSKDKLYSVWASIKQRCLNPNDKNYSRYGGRGIEICAEWVNDFYRFYEWSIQNGYKDGLSIDRINNDGNYTPSNCRWVCRKIQNRNRSSNISVEYNGKMVSIIEASELSGISYHTLLNRYHNGDRDDKLFRHNY